ncbi:GNAT family N-acetyltransferase [Cohnella nanjingensis]|uniref:GNAT family N-acetyltransferase n=1 Tax=Cohnella nanjingensis TaxID=1387779 RepID=A0A7X0RMX6_9BACL|nr:GNAT family N-acetyltransferase [Cohnella nanjingensis]MBB6670341.1 GNAT family N-acetyltransferase [Cohnella nanjingensis]
MIVQQAAEEDIRAWLALASEVESLFGPMVDDPQFILALRKNISRGSALCIREQDALSGSPLLGGLLFSPTAAPIYKIGWLAVARKARGQGIATAFMHHILNLVRSPAQITVTTFGEEVADGLPARRFYIKHGFVPEERVEDGPEGGSRQRFRLTLSD